MDMYYMRDAIVKGLRGISGFSEMVTADLDGSFFTAVDIAIEVSEGMYEIYRVAVVKYAENYSV